MTATYTPLGIFQWKVNVMVLKNASTQFQRMMEDVLEPVRDVANCYIDDIIVGTRVPLGGDLHLQHFHDLCRVMELLKEQKLVVDINKCKLLCLKLSFVATS